MTLNAADSTAEVLVTGGSGFIGTNLVELLLRSGVNVLSVDIQEPRVEAHKEVFRRIDILDNVELENALRESGASKVVHLAARTDLAGNCLDDYRVNDLGTASLASAIARSGCVDRLVFASTKLVSTIDPASPEEPRQAVSHYYAQSKFNAENLLLKHPELTSEIIIARPTSIWGPWFGEPYRKFFEVVRRNVYFHIGSKSPKKQFGYVGNAVSQLRCLVYSENALNREVYYLGDYSCYSIREWSETIARAFSSQKKILTLPLPAALILAKIGDYLHASGIMGNPAMTSFRLRNILDENAIEPLESMRLLLPELPFTMEQGVSITVDWLEGPDATKGSLQRRV